MNERRHDRDKSASKSDASKPRDDRSESRPRSAPNAGSHATTEITALIRCTDGAAREWRRGVHAISTDKRRLDVDAIHAYLSRSYWAEHIPRAVVELSIENSLCFGIYESVDSGASTPNERGERQVGFARLVTDGATFAYLGDVFVLEDARGKGLSKWLMHEITSMAELAGLRRWNLATRDAHGLYSRFGFHALAAPERYMERLDPDVYRRASGSTSPPLREPSR